MMDNYFNNRFIVLVILSDINVKDVHVPAAVFFVLCDNKVNIFRLLIVVWQSKTSDDISLGFWKLMLFFLLLLFDIY